MTIVLRERDGGATQPVSLKLDPGSKTTGLTLVANGRVLWAAELHHRGMQIRDRLQARRAVRRSRRQRKTRSRTPRFLNRRRPEGWLAPSLESRVQNVQTWVARLRRFCPVSHRAMELARFDTQALENPEISGVAYQQGTLVGVEVREFLLEKWGRRCAYCGARGLPLQVEHIVPRARHGSDRVSNLSIACESCNRAKGTQTAEEFGHPEVQAQARQPLRDAAAVNSTRWALYRRLVATGLPVETGSGGRTKFNRTRLGLPKAHWTDAACVGASTPDALDVRGVLPLLITATGHGNRQMAGLNKDGFPIRHRQRKKRHHGFQTGDMVRAVVTKGKYAGVHVGRIAVRAKPWFKLNGIDVSAKSCTALHRADGYAYLKRRDANDTKPGLAAR
jgi:5-methylcytosine-specific restriction endonuclease McrA